MAGALQPGARPGLPGARFCLDSVSEWAVGYVCLVAG
jgi:hypothetical protein